ncbi:MAG: HAD-IC family P-type ATPase [Planctomycetia bacterium]
MTATAVLPDGRFATLGEAAIAADGFAAEPFRGLLATTTSLEAASEHPLARTFLAAAAEAGLEPPPAQDVAAVVGRGVTGRVAGRLVLAGSGRLLAERGVQVPAPEMLPSAAVTVVHVAIDGGYAGSFGLADPPRSEAGAVIGGLSAAGVAMEMLSGDGEAVALAVAGAVGIRKASGGLSPQQKAERIEVLRSDPATPGAVVFVGDGINDAPALAAADVGIAMGTGADVALETADITLLSGGLESLPRALRLARGTMANVRQNLVLAFLYNLLALPVAAGILYPLVGHVTSPMLAAAAMSLSSLSVIANSLRLRRLDLG